MCGQGPTWTSYRPVGLMSKKFISAQQHYAVHELEILAILEALIKWEDKLLRRKIHIITDQKALEFFKTLLTRKCFLLGFAGCNVSWAIPVVH